MGKLSGKTVLMFFFFFLIQSTGASEGIGKATAFLFAEENSNLILVARNEEKLKKIKQEIEEKTSKTLKFNL
jgi:3-hydroxy acid dehydrogenase / malonic semialdehyde reductase